MIKPTVGRIVWYWGDTLIHKDPGQPLAAIVTYVWGDRLVNLAVFSGQGFHHAKANVPLLQDGDVVPYPDVYCKWMPYQKGQAAKAEAAEDKLVRHHDEPQADHPLPLPLARAEAYVATRPAGSTVTVDGMLAKIKDTHFWHHETLTVCVIKLENGFFVVGHSACVDPANFDAVVGERYAYENAFKQIWQLEGYALRERMHANAKGQA